MAPVTSILIPVYNREDLVGECIKSALSQSVTDLEVVVVDNASTDGTWDVIQRYSQIDSRVRGVRNDCNVGPVRNWMRCIQEARGRYGKLLFSDDLMGPEFLEKTLPLIADNRVGFVFSAIEMGDKPGTGSYSYWHRHSGLYPSKDYIMAALCSNKTPVSPGAAIFRLSDLQDHLVTDIPSSDGIDFARNGAGPDQLLYLLTARCYPSIGYVADPVSFFRKHQGSITVGEDDEALWSQYFQARVWYAGRSEACEISLPKNLLQLCLASGWLRQKNKKQPGVTLARFVRRFWDGPTQGMMRAIMVVRWFRIRLRWRRGIEKWMLKKRY